MNPYDKRLALFSEAEYSALYDLPDFDNDQRLEFLSLTEQECALVQGRESLSAQVHCALQIGYFKAKQFFYRFEWEDVPPEDIEFVLLHYFSEQHLEKQVITKYEYYAQCQIISDLFGYQRWSKSLEKKTTQQIEQIIMRDTSPRFILMELLSFFKSQKIIRPRYTTLQVLISEVLQKERQRLAKGLQDALTSEHHTGLKTLLTEENLMGLAALKQDAKHFKARIMATEREKLATMKSLYHLSKVILPTLKLSKQNIHYYAGLTLYYTFMNYEHG